MIWTLYEEGCKMDWEKDDGAAGGRSKRKRETTNKMG